MNTYVVLLRGINVGGKNLLPMKELKALLENHSIENNGFKNVRTYIQSGNILLESSSNPEAEISAIINTNFGFQPKVLILTKEAFFSAVSNNPYPEFEGKFVHFYFCKNTPELDSKKLEAVISETERYELIDNVLYIHAPDGIARSKLIVNIEKCLGVSATGRNLNTVTKLSGMLQSD